MTRQLKQVLLIRTALLKTLSAEKENLYCKMLSLWLKKRCSRDEFDFAVTKILSDTGIKLHTKFLSKLSKLCSGLMALPLVINCRPMRTLSDCEDSAVYRFIDQTIPCQIVCYARFLVSAWSSGIISVNADMGKFLHTALIQFLKEIIFSLITVKKSFKLRINNIRQIEGQTSSNKLPLGLNEHRFITSNHLMLALKLNPSLVKMSSTRYIERVINGPSNVKNITKLMPLDLY